MLRRTLQLWGICALSSAAAALSPAGCSSSGTESQVNPGASGHGGTGAGGGSAGAGAGLVIDIPDSGDTDGPVPVGGQESPRLPRPAFGAMPVIAKGAPDNAPALFG